MKNIILQERINYWKKEYPNRKFLELGSPLYLIINEADQTPGISWLTPKELINFVDESVKSFINLATKGLNQAENKSKPELIKPVLDLMREHRDNIINSEISGDTEILIGGIKGKITKDEIIRHSLRMNKILRTRNDVVEVLKDLISYKRNLYQLTDQEKTHSQLKSEIKYPDNYISVPVWALHYYYLQNAKIIPYFDAQTITKDEAIQKVISENGHTFSWKNFRNAFYSIGNGKEKDPLKESYLKKVIISLDNYPTAKQLAENDLCSYEKRATNQKFK